MNGVQDHRKSVVESSHQQKRWEKKKQKNLDASTILILYQGPGRKTEPIPASLVEGI